eukprot:scaffold57959_cov22-Tisochrysis_lutea.AAC.1
MGLPLLPQTLRLLVHSMGGLHAYNRSGCNQLQHWALHFHGRGDAAHGGLSRHIPGAANEGLFRDLPEAKLT